MHRIVLRILTLTVVAALASGCLGGTVLKGHGRVGQPLGAPKRPELADAAKEHTADGAVAFARYYLDLVSWAVETDDWQSVQEVSDPACLECMKLRAGLERFVATNDSLRSERVVVDSAVLLRHRVLIGAQYGVDVEIHSEWVSARPESQLDAGVTHHRFLSIWTNWRDGRWTVFALTPDT